MWKTSLQWTLFKQLWKREPQHLATEFVIYQVSYNSGSRRTDDQYFLPDILNSQGERHISSHENHLATAGDDKSVQDALLSATDMMSSRNKVNLTSLIDASKAQMITINQVDSF